ncbi:MAG: iron chelate uptake ABC transporter family permease subunit, partial [Lachnospiraceae bacterium]|nr:iron chelate uptake ABC transporter family permease subunit [Lachnospiraceae bacterium]
MRIGLKESIEIKKEDNRKFRRNIIILILITIAAFLVFMNAYSFAKFNPPSYTWRCIRVWFEYAWAIVTKQPRLDIESHFPGGYQTTFKNIKSLFMAMGCGALLALSGNIFQNVFRNPMAAPTMLGINTGVQAGMLYMVIIYGGAALTMTRERYIICYLGAAIMLAAVMFLGKLASGRGRFAVEDLILVGVALSQIVGAVLTGYTNGMDTDVLAIYQMVSMGSSLQTDWTSILWLLIAFGASVIPMYLLRFSFNVVSFTPDETKGLGVDSGIFRFVTLIIGTFMVTAAMVHCGVIGMLALAVPHMGRAFFGSDFRKQFWANMLLGVLLLMVCRGVVILMPWVLGQYFPISIIVNIMVPPIFAIFLVKSKRGVGMMKLELKRVSVGYDVTAPVLEDINFSVDTGEICCILGPNGVGKTTLFRSILKFMPILNGEIRIDGKDIRTWPHAVMAKYMAYVAQYHNPPFPYEVKDVVLLGRVNSTRYFGQPDRQDYEIAENAMKDMGIHHLRNRYYTDISGGERQLVMIARALAQQPSFLVLDEPTANLDYGNTIRVLHE